MLRFLSAPKEPVDASVLLVGAPLDLTTSFRPGTRFAPERIRSVSEGLESYSPHWKRDLADLSWADEGDVSLSGDLVTALEELELSFSEIYGRGNKLLLLGGEHLVTYPAVCAAHAAHPDLAVVCWDAHADLRNEYLGLRFSHATVGRRILERVGEAAFFQAGVRSMTREESAFTQEFWGNDLLAFSRNFREKVGERPVYLSIDVDVLDPAYAPGTGAPEPGGITTRELFHALYALEGINLVGVDVVEVCPSGDVADVTSLLAAKLARELLFMLAS